MAVCIFSSSKASSMIFFRTVPFSEAWNWSKSALTVSWSLLSIAIASLSGVSQSSMDRLLVFPFANERPKGLFLRAEQRLGGLQNTLNLRSDLLFHDSVGLALGALQGEGAIALVERRPPSDSRFEAIQRPDLSAGNSVFAKHARLFVKRQGQRVGRNRAAGLALKERLIQVED